MGAAFQPSLYPVWTARGADAVALIADRRASWQLANWLLVIATMCTLTGMAGLTRLTSTVGTVDAFRAGDPVPRDYELIDAWVEGLWLIGSLAASLAVACYGLAVIGGGPLPAWCGWLAVAFGMLMLGLFLVNRDVPPIIWCMAPLALGVTALITAARMAVTP